MIFALIARTLSGIRLNKFIMEKRKITLFAQTGQIIEIVVLIVVCDC